MSRRRRATVAETRRQRRMHGVTAPGAVRYLDRDLPFCGVTGVTTSHVARKQGLPRARRRRPSR
jgi:hypothetical protein